MENEQTPEQIAKDIASAVFARAELFVEMNRDNVSPRLVWSAIGAAFEYCIERAKRQRDRLGRIENGVSGVDWCESLYALEDPRDPQVGSR